MDETRAIILAMTDQAIREWADGTVEPMFPMADEDTVLRMWHMAANAMAYGLWKGIEFCRKEQKEAVK